MNICVYLLAKLFYMWCNKKREKEWNAMTEEVSISFRPSGATLITDINSSNKFTTSRLQRTKAAPEKTFDSSIECYEAFGLLAFGLPARVFRL